MSVSIMMALHGGHSEIFKEKKEREGEVERRKEGGKERKLE